MKTWCQIKRGPADLFHTPGWVFGSQACMEVVRRSLVLLGEVGRRMENPWELQLKKKPGSKETHCLFLK